MAGIIKCRRCGAEVYKQKSAVYCSRSCKSAANYVKGRYRGINSQQKRERRGASVESYIKFHLQAYRRSATISFEELYNIYLKQEGRCALTGVPLTWKLEKGVTTWTNLSLDRIVPGGPYTAENIRLVCRIVNVMRHTLEDAELLSWCKLILEHKMKSTDLVNGFQAADYCDHEKTPLGKRYPKQGEPGLSVEYAKSDGDLSHGFVPQTRKESTTP